MINFTKWSDANNFIELASNLSDNIFMGNFFYSANCLDSVIHTKIRYALEFWTIDKIAIIINFRKNHLKSVQTINKWYMIIFLGGHWSKEVIHSGGSGDVGVEGDGCDNEGGVSGGWLYHFHVHKSLILFETSLLWVSNILHILKNSYRILLPASSFILHHSFDERIRGDVSISLFIFDNGSFVILKAFFWCESYYADE